MRKTKILSKVFGVGLVLVMIGAMVGGTVVSAFFSSNWAGVPSNPISVSGGGAENSKLKIVLLGNVTSHYYISGEGEVLEDVNTTSQDKVLVVALARGTTALDKDGKKLEFITVSKEDNPPQPPSGCYFVGDVYDMAPDGAVFAPSLSLSLAYDESALPEGMQEERLYLAYYDKDKGQWTELTSKVDAAANKVTANISHFTSFVIMARPPRFTFSDFSVSPHLVKVWEPVTVKITVTNGGGCEGNYTVALKVNEVIEASEEVQLGVNESREVSFEVVREKAGTYTVDVDGHTATFIAQGTNWALIGGIIGGVVVSGLLVYFLVFRKRRARPTTTK